MDQTGAVGAWVEPLESTPGRAGRRRRVGVDPRLLRLGIVSVAVVLMVPVALAVRDSGPSAVRSSGPDGGASGPAAADHPVQATTTTLAAASTAPASAAPTTRATPTGGAGRAERRALAAMKAPAEPVCAGTYTVVAGDYWIRFVDSSGADLDAWLSSNGASVDTPLYAGDELCIPAGASAPAPPPSTTVPPATTVAPDTTVPPSTVAPTNPPTTAAPPPTTQPPTTQPPTTEPPPPTTVGPPVSPGDAEAIIRQIWPDELEGRALVIAQRESSLQPDAYNGWCCYGLFQIYFEANRSFLASMGVTAAEHLFDARTNVTVAYAMYQRSGWSPWASTDPG
jgi:hypothetical protein